MEVMQILFVILIYCFGWFVGWSEQKKETQLWQDLYNAIKPGKEKI